MVMITGTVKYIAAGRDSSGSDVCRVGIHPAYMPPFVNLTEHMFLWVSGPPVTDPQGTLNYAMLLLLRDAYLNNSPVGVQIADNSALITGVLLGQWP